MELKLTVDFTEGAQKTINGLTCAVIELTKYLSGTSVQATAVTEEKKEPAKRNSPKKETAKAAELVDEKTTVEPDTKEEQAAELVSRTAELVDEKTTVEPDTKEEQAAELVSRTVTFEKVHELGKQLQKAGKLDDVVETYKAHGLTALKEAANAPYETIVKIHDRYEQLLNDDDNL